MLNRNLRHAIANSCKDPDCEIHHPEVGFAEKVVTQTELAFFYAGAMAMRDLIDEAYTENGNVYNSIALSTATARLRAKHIP